MTAGAGLTVDGLPVFTSLPASAVTNNATGLTLTGTFAGNGAGLTNLNLSSLPAAVVTNFETGVTLNNLNVSSNLNLPAKPIIYAGSNTLVYADTNANFFAGLGAGSASNLSTNVTANTAIGNYALASNTNGFNNVAIGTGALYDNTSGGGNEAIGYDALEINTNGGANVAIGNAALRGNYNGNENTAVGNAALYAYQSSFSGNNNIALGAYAGGNFQGTESGNIDIGNGGTAGDNNIIRIGDPAVQTATYLVGNVHTTGTVTANGVLLTSDRNAKENFTAINALDVLSKVAALPVTEWNYKTDSKAQPHIGPMAQDFQAAFGLNGADDKHISVVDEGGVALAAIQGLNQEVQEKAATIQAQGAEIQTLKQQNDALATQLQALAAAVKALAERK